MASIARRGVRGIYKLYVGNLPWTVSNNELKQYFEKFGPVKSAIVKFSTNPVDGVGGWDINVLMMLKRNYIFSLFVYKDSSTGLSKHFGFVHFFERDTYSAVQAEENHLLENVKLIVSTVNVGIQTPQTEQPNKDPSRRRRQAISDDE